MQSGPQELLMEYFYHILFSKDLKQSEPSTRTDVVLTSYSEILSADSINLCVSWHFLEMMVFLNSTASSSLIQFPAVLLLINKIYF